MDANNQDPVVQGNQSEGGSDEGHRAPGAEARIAELVAKASAAERLAQSQQDQINTLLATIANQNVARPTEEAPPFDMSQLDPEEVKRIEYFTNKATSKVEKQLAEMREQN